MISNTFYELSIPRMMDMWYVSTEDIIGELRGFMYLHKDLCLHPDTGYILYANIKESPGYWLTEKEANQARNDFYKKHNR